MKKIISLWLPIHWVFATYALTTGILAFFFSTADNVFSIHIFPRLLIISWLLLWTIYKDQPDKKTWQFINMALPLSVLGFFYHETQFLNQFLITFRDPQLVDLEYWLFGFQPSLALSKRFSSYWMVELMHMAYFSYFLITAGFCLYLCFNNQRKLERSVFIIITSFLLFYLFFLVYPAAGPQFYFDDQYTTLPEGGFFQSAVNLIQFLGEGPTAAFPSSHVAITLIVIYLSYIHARPVFYIVLPIGVLLSLSAVYIKAHYAIDVLAAFVAAPVAFKSSSFLWETFKKNHSNTLTDSKIIVREVKSYDDLSDFIRLPSMLHKNHDSWTPSLMLDEWKLFDPEKNPAFGHCSTIRLVAFRDDEPVGRITGIIHHYYNKQQSEKNARFAFLEVPDDYAVYCSLMHSVESWATEKGCTGLVGPFGFSDKDPQGFVIEGFEQPAVMFTNGNFSFLPKMTEQYGFQQFKRLVQYKLPINEQIIDQLTPFAQRALRNGKLVAKEFTRTRDIKPYVNTVFELINNTYSNIYGFSEVTKQEADDFANRFLPLLDPRLIKMVFDESGTLAAFVVAMPNLAPGLKKSGGKLLPFGWFHLFVASKKSTELVLLLGAIREDLRNRGADAIMGEQLIRSAIKLGFKNIDSHLILEENMKMRREIERLKDFSLYKRYSIYYKALS
jgi:membrane-associated phospholipid phosphatase